MINIDIHQINKSVASTIFFLIMNVALCTFCIFTSDKELFVSLEFSKIVLLSLGIIAILIILNYSILFFTKSLSRYIDSDGFLNENDLLGDLLLFIQLPLFMDAFNGLSSIIFSSKKTSIIYPLIIWIIFSFVFNIIRNRKEKRKKENLS